MNIVAQQVDVLARRVMVVQIVSAAAAAIGMYMLGQGGWSALSAFSGGLVSLAIVLLLRRGVRRASDLALVDQKKSLAILYLGAVQRFVAVIVLFALGMGVFGLVPFAMFVGFVAAQVGNLIGARFR